MSKNYTSPARDFQSRWTSVEGSKEDDTFQSKVNDSDKSASGEPFGRRKDRERPTGISHRVNRGFVNGNSKMNNLRPRGPREDGIVNGNGFVNGNSIPASGLVNGDGLKFLEKDPREFRIHVIKRRKRNSLISTLMITAALILVPLFYMMVIQPARPGMMADGRFDDWRSVPLYASIAPPEKVQITRYGWQVDNDFFGYYFETSGPALSGVSSPDPSRGILGLDDTGYVFIDTDSDLSTGYSINGLGADYMIAVAGYNGSVESSALYAYRGNGDDWNGFEKVKSVDSACSGHGVEGMVWLGDLGLSSGNKIRVSFSYSPASGDIDVAQVPHNGRTSVYVDGTKHQYDTLNGSFLAYDLTLYSEGGPSVVSALVFESSHPVESVNLRGEGGSAAGSIKNSTGVITVYFDTPLYIPGLIYETTGPKWSMSISVRVTPSSELKPGSAFSFTLVDVVSNSPAILSSRVSSPVPNGYYLRPPSYISIDGAFGDWPSSTIYNDTSGDTGHIYNPSVDIVRYGSVGNSSGASFYIEINGTEILSGRYVPHIHQYAREPVKDTDGDGIADEFDPYPDDYDNDNISDEFDSDIDGDGVNNTEDLEPRNPSVGTFRPIRRVLPMLGRDTVAVFVNTDNNAGSGYMPGIGADYMVQVQGRGGTIEHSALYWYSGNGADWQWRLIDDVNTMNFGPSIELFIDWDLLPYVPAVYSYFIVAHDWGNTSGDRTDTRGPLPGGGWPSTRSYTINVSDDSAADWDPVPTTFIDQMGETSIDGTDLTLVAFATDDTWLYIRWDIYNTSTWNKPDILYDIGLNRTGDGSTMDIFCAAYIEKPNQGSPYLSSVTIRDINDNYLWTGDPNVDGEIIFDPVPGTQNPGSHFVEARFPLSVLNLATEVILGQFRSHASSSVSSSVKDYCPENGFIKYNSTTGVGGVVTNPGDPMPAAFTVEKKSGSSAVRPGDTVQWFIYYNNSGESNSSTVYINETIPFDMTYIDDNASEAASRYGGNVTRNVVGWTSNGYEISYVFDNVTPSHNVFVINCTVNTTATLDNLLTNYVTLDFTENPGLPLQSSASIYVSPVDIEIGANKSTAAPGEWVGWIVYFNNTGSSSYTVWVNITLPFDMTFQEDNSSICAANYGGTVVRNVVGWTDEGYLITYKFTDVPPGNHMFQVNATVNDPVSRSLFTANASLEIYGYTMTDSKTVEVPELGSYVIALSTTILLFLRVRRRRRLKKE